MKTAIIAFLLKFVSVDQISRIIAICVSRLIKYASSRGDKAWAKTKSVMKSAERWTKLFNEVYEDDTLTEEEELKIADAIANLTAAKKISGIISEKKQQSRQA